MKTKETKDLEQRLVRLKWKRVNHVIFEVDLCSACHHTYAKNARRPLGDPLGGYCPDIVGIADAISFETDGTLSCYEIKVSVSDFHSKAKLSFIGDKNYFVLTEKVWNSVKDEIKEKYPSIGVYIPDGQYWLKCVKPAKRVDMEYDREAVLVCMLTASSNETTQGNIKSSDISLKWQPESEELE